MKLNSLDPRISRSELPAENEYNPKGNLDQWETYEVFHQTSRGAQHVHVGSLHAPSAEIALIFAKEQYARRMKCVNLWVVPTSRISATSYDDSDMFEPATDKSYREAFGYKNKHLIQKFNEEKAKSL
jgi:ring-1,2-phenylacetyl-CoA epoxidase subunit PaaB